MNIYLIILSFTITLSLAANSTERRSLEENLHIADLISSDELKNSNSIKKRYSGYLYPKPKNRVKYRSRFILNEPRKNRGRFSRLNAPARPFETYGPPKQTSQQFSINNHPSRRPFHQQNKIKLHSGADAIRFPSSNLLTENLQLEVPSPIREVDFIEPSSIASQNEEPFKLNAANYLPPKNQRLPISHTTIFQPSSPSLNLNQFNQNIQDNHDFQQGFNLINQNHNQQSNTQISDAVQFLVQNSAAISDLYNAPASDINYAPIDTNLESLSTQVQNFNQNEELSNVQSLQRSFPSYASGTLEPYQALEQIQSLEKDRLIAQLQQELVQRQVQDPSSYVQQSEDESKKLSSLQSSQLDNSASIFNVQAIPFGTRIRNLGERLESSKHDATRSLTYDVPTIMAQSQTTSPTAISNASVNRPQNSEEGISHEGTLVPTSSKPPPTVFPFPQYGGFIPTLIAGTNFASPPSYGSTFIGSNSFHPPGQVIESSPTHFDIPIPTVTGNKPSTGTFLNPTTPKPIDSLDSTSSRHPISIFPAIPTVTQVQTPVHSVHTYNQPTLINSVLLKPVKPVYPVYYYPNVSLQKPQYIFPWHYTQPYAQAKSSHKL